ncbi:MAG: energy-coupling factor transporter transmembrane component T, partial [Solirubrobacteraceae bacterium]
MIYRRVASPLHAARAAVAIAWCAALAVGALIESNPVLLGAIAVSVVAGGVLAGVGRELRRSLLWSVPLWLAIGLINALVTRNGLTVIWRLGEIPLVGQTNITLEATVYGGVLGLRAVVLVLVGTLYSVAVDPDEVLRMFRGVSFSSALSATIATRMVPVLLRDSRRLADAQRCRPGPAPRRLALMHASTAGVLDRALDIAA